MRSYELRVVGRVQRVGYRRFVQELAQSLNLAGYVRNEPDGAVSIFIQGEEGGLREFLEGVRSPPPPAMVKDLQVKEASPNPKLKYFEVKYGRLADELQEGFGAMQALFSDYRGEFRDFRQEFRDFRQEFGEFRSESLKISQETLNEVRELRTDLKAILDERLARLERDIAEIKVRLGL